MDARLRLPLRRIERARHVRDLVETKPDLFRPASAQYPCGHMGWRIGVRRLCGILLGSAACQVASEGTATTANDGWEDAWEGDTAPGSSGEMGSSSASESVEPDRASESSESSNQAPDPSSTGDGSSMRDSTSSGADFPDPVLGARCGPLPTCDVPPPPASPPVDWNVVDSYVIEALGAPNHRGRDMFFVEGQDQWILAKFAYGLADTDLEGERVDLYVLRDCTGDWESLGSATTTFEGNHPTIEGVADTGGRVYLQLSEAQRLGPGRHRVHMVVAGDQTRADVFIEIVPRGAPMFISDVDGTLTTFESEEFVDLLTGTTPDIHPFAADVLQLLAAKGYHPMYLTARPEFLGLRTAEFVAERGLPPGIIHTTLEFTGALGDAAATYKTGELDMLTARGLHPTFVFGNTDSDGQAYDNASIEPLDRRFFIQFDDPFGGRRIESYGELLGEFQALPDLCQPG